jgi:CheY-like chemotaxis protein
LSSSSAAHREQAERCGIDSFLTKPFSSAALAEMVGDNAKSRAER